MKQALFIHGFNSDEHSSTGAKVKDVLMEAHFSTTIKTFDVLNPFKTKKEIEELLKSGSFDLVVGHSLGGFYTLIATSPNVKKILINPSIAPDQDLRRISSIEEVILKDFATLNEEKRETSNEEEKESVFALFGKKDELLTDDERGPYLDLFLRYYGNHYVMLDCTHRPDEASLKIGLPLALKTVGLFSNNTD